MTATIEIFKFEKNVDYYDAGETIFQAGDEGNCMYVVQAGEVDVMVGETLIETIGPGGIFGEMALIDRSPRSATIVARADCRLVALDETKFMPVSYTHLTLPTSDLV